MKPKKTINKRFILEALFGSIHQEFDTYNNALHAYHNTKCPKTLLSIDDNHNIKVIFSHY